MIQLNLLPDVKLDYIRAQRFRKLVLTVSVLVGAASIVLLLFLLSLDGLQKKHLDDLQNDIGSETHTLQSTPQLNQILTVQNQLQSITALHTSEPAASRLFDDLYEITPATVDITNLDIDFTQQTATITGTADALSSVNTFIDTMKYTDYSVAGSSNTNKAFSNVVLTTFNPASTTDGASEPADYTITLSFDENIFNITKSVTLSVPSLIATRSQVAQPTDLFSAPASSTSTSGSGQ
jgi:Tfp pilus assembly protein PilN